MLNDDPWSNPKPLTDLELAELDRLEVTALFEQMQMEHELLERLNAVELNDATSPVREEPAVQQVHPVAGDYECLPANLFGGANPRG